MQIVASELIAKLSVNSLLAIAATVALVRLVSYNVAQHDKLRLLETEVQASQVHLDAERSDFQHYFDPQQARSIMREQSYRVEPGQAQIIFHSTQSSSGSSLSGQGNLDSRDLQPTASPSDPSNAGVTPAPASTQLETASDESPVDEAPSPPAAADFNSESLR